MRTLFWCGCAVTVAAAIGVYLTADYTAQHPDTPVAHCVHAASSAVLACNPVTGFGPKAAVHACKIVGRVVREMQDEEEQAAAPPPHPVVRHHEEPKPVEVIDLDEMDRPAWGIEPDNAEESEPPATPAAPPTDDDTAITIPPTTIIEAETTESEPVADATTGEEWEPLPFPQEGQADDQPVAKDDTFSFWMKWFHSTDEGADEGMGEDAEKGSAKTQEPEELPPPAEEEAEHRPTIEDVIQERIEIEEASTHYWDTLLGWFGFRTEETQPQDGMTEVEQGTHEEAETINPGMAPDNQVDANPTHEYPACPYMGGNPAHSCPTPQEDETPHRVKKHKKQAPKEEEPGDEEMAEPESLDLTKPDEESPHHPEVDTMEFRKSDAHKGEFDPHPF